VIAASSGSIDIVGKAAPALVDFDGGFGAFCKVLRPKSNVHPVILHTFSRQRITGNKYLHLRLVRTSIICATSTSMI